MWSPKTIIKASPLLMSLFMASAHAENWAAIGVAASNSQTVYVDNDSIEREGGFASIWLKVGIEKRFLSFNAYTDSIEQVVLNCEERTFAVTKSFVVRSNGERVSIKELAPSDWSFGKVLAASPIGNHWSRFCPTKVASAPVATPAIPEKPAKPEISVTSGTGWHVADGYIVTAFHVIEGASAIGVDIGKDEYLPAKVITYDASNDLAILHVQHPSLKDGLTLATSSARLGGKVFTLGYPLPDALGVKIQVTSGEVSALTGAANDPRFYQITAPVQSGASGGPVFSEDGQVVGVIISKTNFMKQNTGRVEILQNINFAVKYPYVAALLETTGVRIIRQTQKSANREDAVKQAAGQVFYIEAYRKKE